MYRLLLVFLSLQMIIPSGMAQNDIIFENKVYSDLIKTVQLFPLYNTVDQELQTPVVSLRNNPGLMLQFDALLEDYEALQAKIIHCNADWTRSMLSDIEIMDEYNSFDLDDFEYSENTKVLYVNYFFRLPPTKVSGNFAIKVYRHGDESDVLFTKRFVVFEDLITINSDVRVSSSVSNRNFNQQIEFSINYGGIVISNPLSDIYVVLRQNQRWDNAIYGLKPTLVRQDQSYIEYRHFNQENNFQAGNEFRFFDIRTYLFRGQNIAFINSESNPMSAHVTLDKRRSSNIYSQYRDNNGQYFIETREPQAGILESDYFRVKFDLSSPTALKDKVYVIGAFNDWQRNTRNEMIYNSNAQSYTCEILLKQGVYNYMYYVENDPYYFEGSFYQTENEYDILVYYRPLGAFTEKVIGYTSFRPEF